MANPTATFETSEGVFKAEILLEEGANRIHVEALLDDGATRERSFVVGYVPGTPTDELERQLESLRSENGALLERIRGDGPTRAAARRLAREAKGKPARGRPRGHVFRYRSGISKKEYSYSSL